MKKIFTVLCLSAFIAVQYSCSKSSGGSGGNDDDTINPGTGTNEVDFWLTTGDQAARLEKQSSILEFGTAVNSYNTIEVDEAATYQTIDGFGYTLTGGSVDVINTLNATRRQELLQDLFNPGSGIGVSYLRLSIGASDLNAAPFTYDDMPAGETDTTLANFSLSNDSALIAMLKEILAINPDIKIMGAPWSAPVWMKTNGSFTGGSLQAQYYSAYAQYFVKYIQGMQAEGIKITAITPQNEPLNPYNTPSLVMQATEQANFIANNLGPAFQAAGITTKIVVYDHNCDVTSYPISILNNSAASAYVDGSAFHLYGGDISAMTTVHNAAPSKNVYFTEQYTSATATFSDDLKWLVKNVVIGSMRNWSKNALIWNLATNGSYGPHTNGGCTTCKGAFTITSSDSYTKNVAYYIVAQASKFIPAGSIRINSTVASGLNTVAFKRPDGKHVLLVENDNPFALTYNIKYNGEWIVTKIEANSVGTYIW